MTRVHLLSERLRANGVDCDIDQYDQQPADHWWAWCERGIREADFVLVACTEQYQRRFSGETPQGEGDGVLYEAKLIRQFIATRQARKFIPVLFADGRREDVPLVLGGATFYQIEDQKSFENLLRILTNQQAVVKGDLGPIPEFPEKPLRIPPRNPYFTDRDIPLGQLFDELKPGQAELHTAALAALGGMHGRRTG